MKREAAFEKEREGMQEGDSRTLERHTSVGRKKPATEEEPGSTGEAGKRPRGGSLS